ncbi:MAG TPA: tagatose 1,6-diphosphate aldolase [Devosiaceae bacterium]
MKKMLNQVQNAVDEMLAGYVTAYPSRVARAGGDGRILVRARPKASGKVALVIGNGSGHEPIAMGWVGEGLLDANAVGDIFAAPPPDLIAETIAAADRGGGVLLLISSHSGDIINGEAGADLARENGHRVEILLMYDDISTAPRSEAEFRRGAPGTTFIYKLCGALAEEGAPLEEVKRLGERVRDATATLGASLQGGISPLTGQQMFTLPDNEVFIGVGVHGEPGMARMPAGEADVIVDYMMEKLLADLPFSRGDEVFVLVNGMGATTLMELSVIYRRVGERLHGAGIGLADEPLIGSYVTTQDSSGFSVSLLKADDEMRRLWRAPDDAPFYHHQRKAPAAPVNAVPAPARDKAAALTALGERFGFMAALAIDQGSSLGDMIVAAGAKGADAESLLFDFKRVLVEELSEETSAVLVDHRFGDSLQAHASKGTPIFRGYESDVYSAEDDDRLTTVPLDASVRMLRDNGAAAIKLHCYYEAGGADDLNAKKRALVERVGAECAANGIPFLFEPLVHDRNLKPGTEAFARQKPQMVRSLVEEFSDPRYGVDILKIELPFDVSFVEGTAAANGATVYTREAVAEATRELGRLARVPIVFLSAGVTAEAFTQSLEIANEAGAAYGGFVVGRAIWKDAIPVLAAGGVPALRQWARETGRDRFRRIIDAARSGARLA